MKQVFIAAARRTPVGSFMGSLAGLSASQLGAVAIRDIYERLPLDPARINSVYLGNVLSAGLGQAPARQAAMFAGLLPATEATTINKVCSSGIKATTLGAQQIMMDLEELVITGGMESMSNTPHYVNLRKGQKFGNAALTDGMIKDGLWDVYHDFHMGNAAELGVRKFGLSRSELDDYALRSYGLARAAADEGKFRDEIVPVTVSRGKQSSLLSRDEDIDKVIPEKLPKLAPAFEPEGSLTAANSSNLNDGAAMLLLGSGEAVKKFGLKPLARIIGFADAAQEPEWFTTAPALAIPKALRNAGVRQSEVDYFEINEAYASVVLSNVQLLGLDLNKVNVYGGAVAIGHPIGASGARIIVTLLSVLRQEGGKYGVAAICNGGGGATALVVENLM